jgi:uncharacterized protein YjbI with pentapeptide repeats
MLLAMRDAARASGRQEDRPNLSKGHKGNGYRGEGHKLRRLNISGQTLNGFIFNDCDCTEVNAQGANLEGTLWIGAKIDRMNVQGANLRFAVIPANFLEATINDGPAQIKRAYIQDKY